jgi:hypothetical protein
MPDQVWAAAIGAIGAIAAGIVARLRRGSEVRRPSGISNTMCAAAATLTGAGGHK